RDESQIREIINAGSPVLWIDARKAEKYQTEHFPGAISIPGDDWAEAVFENRAVLESAMNQAVIVYCDGSRCAKSKEVSEKLRQLMGLQQVYVLRGDWRKLRSEVN
ncbi:MAG: rhodanese-like domain-containing protein, partial [Verrucomicrobiota bacterium]